MLVRFWFVRALAAAMSLLVGVGVGVAASQDQATRVVERTHGGYSGLGSARDWTAIGFGASEQAGRPGVCAIYSRPVTLGAVDGSAAAPLRGEVSAFVTWETGVVGAAPGVSSFIVGYPVDPTSASHGVSIDGGPQIGLFGLEDRLFVNPEDDARVVAAMRAGREMRVRSHLLSGVVIEDVYSLMGVQATTRSAAAVCR